MIIRQIGKKNKNEVVPIENIKRGGVFTVDDVLYLRTNDNNISVRLSDGQLCQTGQLINLGRPIEVTAEVLQYNEVEKGGSYRSFEIKPQDEVLNQDEQETDQVTDQVESNEHEQNEDSEEHNEDDGE